MESLVDLELNSTTFEYLYTFYGSSGPWFAIYVGCISAFIVVSNIFFTLLTLTSTTLRQNSANWFLIGSSIAEQFLFLAHVVDAYAIYTGSVYNRHLCSVSGTFVIIFATSGFGFPAMIAADRYYKICTISRPTDFSISNAIFSKRGSLILIIGWFFVAALSNLPLLLDNSFGEDPNGFCGAKKFTKVPLMLSYLVSVAVPFFGSLALTAVYYYHLMKWLNQHKVTTTKNHQEVDYTRAIMRVMKIVTALPVVLDSPVLVLTSFQMILPEMPMWLTRALCVPYFFSSAANPWLTIALVKQFRTRFKQLAGKTKTTVIVKVDSVINRTTAVQPISITS